MEEKAKEAMKRIGLTGTEISVKLSKRNPKAKWILFGDVHCGNSAYDRKAFMKLQENILELAKKSVVIVTGMGDLLDSIVPGDRRFSLAEHKKTFTQAQEEILEWFKTLKKNKNIRFNGVLYGNHEYVLIKNGVFPFAPLRREIGLNIYGTQTHNLIRFKVDGRRDNSVRIRS